MPVLSIIIPVYNVEKYLEACLNSILLQNNIDIEILLIDDGSNDKSGKICDNYAFCYKEIKVLHQANKGVSTARNIGIKEATGEYILFIDADDMISTNSIYSLIKIAHEKNIDILSFGYQEIRNEMVPPQTEKSGNIEVAYQSFTGIHPFSFMVWAYLIKRSLIFRYDIHFSESIKCAEDQEFIIKCMLHSKIYASTSEIFYFYRKRNDSLMALLTYDGAKNNLDVVKNLINYSKTNYIKEKLLIDFINQRCVSLTKSFFHFFVTNPMMYKRSYSFANKEFRLIYPLLTIKNSKDRIMFFFVKIDIRIYIVFHKIYIFFKN